MSDCNRIADEPFVVVPDELGLAEMQCALADFPVSEAGAAVDHAMRHVDHWSHSATGGAHERREPMFYDLHLGTLGPRPRRQPGRAPGGQGCAEYGHDADGLIIIAHTHRSPWGLEVEVWLSREESIVLAPASEEVTAIRRAVYDGERMVAFADLQLRARDRTPLYRTATFVYTSAGLDSVRWVGPGAHGPQQRYCTIERRPKRRHLPVWRPPEAASAPPRSDAELEDMIVRLTDGLAKIVLELASAAKIEEPVYFVNLNSGQSVTMGKSQFMVQVSPGTIRDRARIMRRRPYKPLDVYVHHDSGGVNCEIDENWGLGSLVDLGHQVEIELHRRRDDRGIEAIWRELTRRLTDRDWGDCFAITDDFLVVATPSGPSPKDRARDLVTMLGERRFDELLQAETARAEALAAADPGPPPVPIGRALKRLRAEVEDHGVSLPVRAGVQIDFGSLLDAFTSFVRTPISGFDPLEGRDAVLVEWGPTRLADTGFHLTLVRQLSREDDDIQLIRLELVFPIVEALAGLTDANHWFIPPDPDALSAQISELGVVKAIRTADLHPVSISVSRERGA